MNSLLVIDDSPLEHMILQGLLNKYHLFPGAEFRLEAESVIAYIQQAHRFHKNKLPDLILLDLNMPGFTGWDFLERFKDIQPALKKPVDIYIHSTAVSKDDSALLHLYPFVQEILPKPLTADRLIDLYNCYAPARRIAS